MTELKIIRTDAEQGLAAAFAAARGALPGADGVRTLRERAFETFEAGGLPHRRIELLGRSLQQEVEFTLCSSKTHASEDTDPVAAVRARPGNIPGFLPGLGRNEAT